MNFKISNLGSGKQTIDEPLARQIRNGALGKVFAITVASEFLSLKSHELSIITEITFGALVSGVYHQAVLTTYYSNFKFEDDSFLRTGITEDAVSTLDRCHNLAQAHAYALYLLLCIDNGIPKTGMEPTPIQNYDYKIASFLELNNSSKKAS